jgi:hypothetical protein
MQKRFVLFNGDVIYAEDNNFGALITGGLPGGALAGDRETNMVMEWDTGSWVIPSSQDSLPIPALEAEGQ